MKSKKSSERKKKEQAATSRKKKYYSGGSGNTSNLKKQVDLINQKASHAVTRLANESNMDYETFGKEYNRIKSAFSIMYKVIELGEQMKKLKDDCK